MLPPTSCFLRLIHDLPLASWRLRKRSAGIFLARLSTVQSGYSHKMTAATGRQLLKPTQLQSQHCIDQSRRWDPRPSNATGLAPTTQILPTAVFLLALTSWCLFICRRASLPTMSNKAPPFCLSQHLRSSYRVTGNATEAFLVMSNQSLAKITLCFLAHRFHQRTSPESAWHERTVHSSLFSMFR